MIFNKHNIHINKYLLLLIFTSTYFYLFTRVLWRVGDEGSIVYGALLVTEGAVPYKDFFEVMGPLTFYWLAFFFKLFGSSLMVTRGVLLFTSVSTIGLIYLLSRRYYSGSFDYLPAVFYMIISLPLWPASNHHWDSNFFALLSILLFLIWWEKKRHIYLGFSGFAAGITTCFMQNKGLSIFIIFAILLIVENKYEKNSGNALIVKITTLATSFAFVGILTVIFFYANDALSELIYANAIWPLSQYHKVNSVPYGYGLIELFLPNWLSVLNPIFPPAVSFLIIGSFAFLFIVLISIPIIILFVGILDKISSKQNRFFDNNILPLLLSGLALWLSELHRSDILHIIYGSPILIILFFLIIFTYFKKNKYTKDILLGFLSFCMIIFATYNALIALNAREKLTTRKGEIYSFKKDDCLEFLKGNTKEGDWVFVYPYYPMYYYLANVKNPTQYSILMHKINTKAQFDEAIYDLEHKSIKYVLWDTFVDGKNLKKWFPGYEHPSKENLEIERYLMNNYQVSTIKNGFRIMEKIHQHPN